MIKRAIIESVLPNRTYKIRIPEEHGINGSAFCTNFADLPIATACQVPNITPNYMEGDKVWVAYEKDEIPVIIGSIQLDKDIDTASDIKANSLDVSGDIKLGGITYENLRSLLGYKGNLKDDLEFIIKELSLKSSGGGGGGGSTDWNDITNKPFNTIGNTLKVSDGVLDINIYETTNPAGGSTLVIGQ